ncbi:hypothetical protein OAL11_00080 [bacterium]|nr:hypothetical protein [bacterium]MDC0302845.1 hypothetical protein [bacterium]
MIRAFFARPKGLKCALTIIHSELVPTRLLGDDRINTVLHKRLIVHKFRGFGVTIRRKESVQLIQLDSIELHPTAIAKQDWALP